MLLSLMLALKFGLTGPALSAALEDVGGLDPLVVSLQQELDRGLRGLSLPGAPPVHHLRYHMVRMDKISARASLGSLTWTSLVPYSRLHVEVRVGEPGFDSGNFEGREDGFASEALPIALTPRALRQVAWQLTDGAYKDAVEQYARKSASVKLPPDYPGDFQPMAPSVDRAGAAAPPDAGPLIARVQALSAAFPEDPRLVLGEVHLGLDAGYHLVLDSEGTRVQRQVEETTIRALVQVRARDGMLLSDHVSWTARRWEQLPDAGAMEAEIRGVSAALLALADAPAMDAEYVGPVLFEGAAAVELFRTLLVEQVEGTPARLDSARDGGALTANFLGDYGANGGDARLGRRVLPPGWTVVDDPGADPQSPAAFVYDSEGTPATAVVLVEDGITRSLLMSRIPRAGVEGGSNGHARGVGGRIEAGAAQLIVTPDRRSSRRRIDRQAARLARAYGRDYVLVVRQLRDPAVHAWGRQLGAFFGAFRGQEQSALAPPVAVYRRYADGREEAVRGARFASVDRYALRDLVAAGESEDRVVLQRQSMTGTPTNGRPLRVVAPAVLVGELELLPEPGDPRDLPAIPPPPPAP